MPDLGAHPALDRLARHAIAGSVVQLLQQDAVVRLGNSRHELWPALRRAWHGGLGSQRPRGVAEIVMALEPPYGRGDQWFP